MTLQAWTQDAYSISVGEVDDGRLRLSLQIPGNDGGPRAMRALDRREAFQLASDLAAALQHLPVHRVACGAIEADSMTDPPMICVAYCSCGWAHTYSNRADTLAGAQLHAKENC